MDKYYKIYTLLKKNCIIFQNVPENVINDLYKLCFQSYGTSLKVITKNNLNCIDHSLGQRHDKLNKQFLIVYIKYRLVPTLQYFGTIVCDRLPGILRLYIDKL